MEMSRHILTKIDLLSLIIDDNCSKVIIIDTYIIITKIILITYGIIDRFYLHLVEKGFPPNANLYKKPSEVRS